MAIANSQPHESALYYEFSHLYDVFFGRVFFPRIVRVLAEISDGELFRRQQDTLRLYKRWLHTRGEREADLLMRRGLIPVAPPQRFRH